jgi:hypothetical protein
LHGSNKCNNDINWNATGEVACGVARRLHKQSFLVLTESWSSEITGFHETQFAGKKWLTNITKATLTEKSGMSGIAK